MTATLALNTNQMNILKSMISFLENKNGNNVYRSKKLEYSDCKHWDCVFSCNCANSRD